MAVPTIAIMPAATIAGIASSSWRPTLLGSGGAMVGMRGAENERTDARLAMLMVRHSSDGQSCCQLRPLSQPTRSVPAVQRSATLATLQLACAAWFAAFRLALMCALRFAWRVLNAPHGAGFAANGHG